MQTTHDYTEFFALIKQRPLKEKSSDNSSCPICGNVDGLSYHGMGTTLLGGGDGTPDGDPNHRHASYTCPLCHVEFMREMKYANVWYTTRDGRIIKGLPSCFEGYIYSCAHCNGDIHRIYTQLDGVTSARWLGTAQQEDGSWKKDYLVFYECVECKRKIQTNFDYWIG